MKNNKRKNNIIVPNIPEHSWVATHEIGKAITSNFNIEEVSSLICKIACEVTNSTAACVVLADNGMGNVSIGGSYKINRRIFSKGPFKFEREIINKLSATKKHLLIKNIKKSKFRHPALVEEPHFKSALCMPVIFNRRFSAAFILYSNKKEAYERLHVRICSSLAYQIALAIQNYNLYTFVHMNYFDTIRALVLAMEARDPYTRGHSERVTQYALMIADSINASPEEIQMIKYCGRLHDIGKIAISDQILNKNASLTRTEKLQIQLHPGKGADMLMPLKFLERGIPLVRYHHERYDGSGYPDGLKAERIPLIARILTCADSYDAMISDRSYRRRLSSRQAVQELEKNAGRQFDPDIVDSFIQVLTEQ